MREGSEGWAGLEAIWDTTWETRYLRIHRVLLTRA
jgi:hypothetical protein